MSQFYAMKSVLENLFGHAVYLRLKETATFKDWRDEATRLLNGIGLAAKCTVQIVDREWHAELEALLESGRSRIKQAETMADLFAGLCSTLVEVVFLQLGNVPARPGSRKTAVPLQSRFWTLDGFRSVQYVQTKKQKEAAQRRAARRAEAAHRTAQEYDEAPATST
jgi:hypothetical protein